MQQVLRLQREVLASESARFAEDRAAWRDREAELYARTDALVDKIVVLASAALQGPAGAGAGSGPGAAPAPAAPAPAAPAPAAPAPAAPAPAAPAPLSGADSIAAALGAVRAGADVLSPEFDQLLREPAAPGPAAAAAADPPREDPDAPSGALPEDLVPPSGPPLVLSKGSDDLFWMYQLHRALLSFGMYSGEDDMEMFVFGEHTEDAVLTFQACK